MRVCKSKKAAVAACVILACTALFAQTQTSPIDMPQMPAMPDMPTIGGGFYTPSFPTRPNNPNKKNSAEKDKDKADSILTESLTPDSMNPTVFSNSGVLTANDISSLYDSGLFSNLSSLGSKVNPANYTTSTSTNVLLQQVLNSLNDLKQQQQSASAKEKNELNAVKADAETFKKREPSILRFKINGYNISDSLTKVFFSETEPDGSFLLSADRRYFVNQQTRTETFYLLFKTVSSNGSSITYKVQPSIVQDSKNENSYIYKLSNVKNLTAEKTGNLVVMHFSSDPLNADLLLDIDNK